MRDLISRSFKVMGVSDALDTTEDKSIYCSLLNDTSSVTQTIYHQNYMRMHAIGTVHVAVLNS
jgi:hypothetical protein